MAQQESFGCGLTVPRRVFQAGCWFTVGQIASVASMEEVIVFVAVVCTAIGLQVLLLDQI